MRWSIVYEKAIDEDGNLFFPEKLSKEILDQHKRTIGSYRFANQYLNEIIPSDLQTFKREWIKYYSVLPKRYNTFLFIDPAISQADSADYTGVVAVHVDSDNVWYISFARRYKITPTQIVDLVFDLNKQFNPTVIGIEAVAYQKALFYFINEEMRRRNVLLPIKDVTPPTTKTKEMRILSLVPRIEWGHAYFNQGLQDLELELFQFPRGAHDDLIDALASIEFIASPPTKEKENDKRVGPQHPEYERQYIRDLIKKKRETEEDGY
jgi:predicted phage terminase large subunit-like protein